MYTVPTITVEADSDYLGEVQCVSFSTVKLLCAPLSVLYSSENSPCAQPTLRNGESCFTSLRTEQMHQLLEILHGRSGSSPSYLIILPFNFLRNANEPWL